MPLTICSHEQTKTQRRGHIPTSTSSQEPTTTEGSSLERTESQAGREVDEIVTRNNQNTFLHRTKVIFGQTEESKGPKEVSVNPILRMLRSLSTDDTVLPPLSPHANLHAVPQLPKSLPRQAVLSLTEALFQHAKGAVIGTTSLRHKPSDKNHLRIKLNHREPSIRMLLRLP